MKLKLGVKTHQTFFVFVVLEQFFRAKLQDVVELLFGHHGSLVAKTRPHHQMSQHHLTLGDLRDSFLDRVARHKAIDQHAVCLTDTMCTTERLVNDRHKLINVNISIRLNVMKCWFHGQGLDCTGEVSKSHNLR